MAELEGTVFLSYTLCPRLNVKDDEEKMRLTNEHRKGVKSLAVNLRWLGVNAIVDQFVEDDPPENWPMWTETYLKNSKWVLVVCTESYYPSVIGTMKSDEQPSTRGGSFEGRVIYSFLNSSKSAKFIPVFLVEGSIEGAKKEFRKSWIPPSISGGTAYVLHLPLPSDEKSAIDLLTRQSHKDYIYHKDFFQLYKRLTADPGAHKLPDLGPKIEPVLPAVHRQLTSIESSVSTDSQTKLNPSLDPNSRLTQRQSLRLAKAMGKDWKLLARTLGFQDGEIDNFEYIGRDDLKEQAYKMLIAWMQKQGSRSTWFRLGEAMDEADLLHYSYRVN